jgi:hypothetical protein
LADQSLEGPLNIAVQESSAGCRDEQRRGARRRPFAVAAGEVESQSSYGRWVQRKFSSLVELRVVDDKDALIRVEVVPIQADRLADAHPSDGEQPDQGLVGRHSQR